MVAIFALMVTPVLAGECPEGQHWVDEGTVIPGYFEDGACNSWADPVCTPGYWQCNQWGLILCWDWEWIDEVCAEPVCTGYEQIWIPEVVVPGGYCEDDEVVTPDPDPEEPVVKVGGGMLLLNGLSPIVSENMYSCERSGNAITCNWLCQQEGTGRLLVNGQSTDYALDGYGHLLGAFGSFGSFANYGYSDSIPATGLTYMTATFNNPNSVYVRPVCIDEVKGEALGSQMFVE